MWKQILKRLGFTSMQTVAIITRIGSKSHADAGRKLGLSRAAVHMRIKRAMKKMTEHMRERFRIAIRRTAPAT